MKKRLTASLLTFAAGWLTMWAQSYFSIADTPTNIIEAIEADSIIFIEQPKALALRLSAAQRSQRQTNSSSETASTSSSSDNTVPSPVTVPVKTAGYRVQVFSDNNARTAKSEARTKAQNISARLPQYRTYVVYQSPYWRLKVGDFPTQSEAENAADEIKKLFPAYAREVRVVKDRINK